MRHIYNLLELPDVLNPVKLIALTVMSINNVIRNRVNGVLIGFLTLIKVNIDCFLFQLQSYVYHPTDFNIARSFTLKLQIN